MVFITIANAVGIAKEVDPVTLGHLEGELYKLPIYCFSEKERQRLLAVKKMFEDFEVFVTSIYKKVVRRENPDLAFRDSQPAYHEFNNCARLLSDYQNIKIPAAIKARGESSIEQFKTWAEANRRIWQENREYFYLRLSAEFNIPRQQIEELHFANSGPAQFRNLDLAQLECELDKLIRHAGRYYYRDKKTTAVLRAFQKKTFLAYKSDPIRYNPTGYPDEEIRRILLHFDETIKKPMRYCLIEYYKVRFNPELAFEGKLLDQLDFTPCRTCIRRESERMCPGVVYA